VCTRMNVRWKLDKHYQSFWHVLFLGQKKELEWRTCLLIFLFAWCRTMAQIGVWTWEKTLIANIYPLLHDAHMFQVWDTDVWNTIPKDKFWKQREYVDAHSFCNIYIRERKECNIYNLIFFFFLDYYYSYFFKTFLF